MLTYEYCCTNKDCENEWEYEAEINDPVLTICPKCNQETAKRLISGGSGRGIVEYTGQELLQKNKEGLDKLRKKVYTDENTYANMVGEGKYQSTVKEYDSQRKIRRS
jgi:putative FmdB family regulatory protein